MLAPGALAQIYREHGGKTVFYGKPYRHVFATVERSVGGGRRLLMVGDSLEHDIARAHGAGWDSVFVQGGLLREKFEEGDVSHILSELCSAEGIPPPIYRMELLA